MIRKENTSIIEEVFNIITHGIGVILSIVGLVMLLNFAHKNFSPDRIVGYSVFGGAIIISYTFSTLYHSLVYTKAKQILKILDHSSIFLLIAGTYTPFMLMVLKGNLGLILLTLIWIFAILGVILKISRRQA